MVAIGPCTLRPRRDHFVLPVQVDLFPADLDSGRDRAVRRWFRECFPPQRPTPQRVLDLLNNGNALPACGLSRQKRSYLIDPLVQHLLSGGLAQADGCLHERMNAVIEAPHRGEGHRPLDGGGCVLIFTLNPAGPCARGRPGLPKIGCAEKARYSLKASAQAGPAQRTGGSRGGRIDQSPLGTCARCGYGGWGW